MVFAAGSVLQNIASVLLGLTVLWYSPRIGASIVQTVGEIIHGRSTEIAQAAPPNSVPERLATSEAKISEGDRRITKLESNTDDTRKELQAHANQLSKIEEAQTITLMVMTPMAIAVLTNFGMKTLKDWDEWKREKEKREKEKHSRTSGVGAG